MVDFSTESETVFTGHKAPILSVAADPLDEYVVLIVWHYCRNIYNIAQLWFKSFFSAGNYQLWWGFANLEHFWFGKNTLSFNRFWKSSYAGLSEGSFTLCPNGP